MQGIRKLVLCGAASALFAFAADADVCHAKTKNVILMISDGQGIGSVMAADFYNGKRAIYEAFPEKYLMTTYSSIGAYKPELAWKSFGIQKLDPTDSAAAATAMATGMKTIPGIVGKTSAMIDTKNVVEVATGLGKSTGVVTSVEFSHATPAGMAAHNASRENYSDIARSMIYGSELDVIMGAGHPYYDNNSARKTDGFEYKYVGGEDVYNDIVDADGAKAKDGKAWKYIDSVEDFQKIASGEVRPSKLLGLAKAATTLNQARSGDVHKVDFGSQSKNVPSLSIMSRAALNSLSTNQNGFFLMVEGGAVDWANHSNQKGRLIEEQTAFNNAVESVVEWVETNSSWEETLLIVTADHECGYLWGSESREFVLVKDNGAGNMPGMAYHAADHSNTPVPFYSKGKGSDMFRNMVDGRDQFFASLLSSFDPGFTGDYIDNTDIFAAINSLMGEVENGSSGNGVWLKGDLHAHSTYSDGDSPLSKVIEKAESLNLDFFVITDHNTTNQLDDPSYKSDKIKLLYGFEWTTGKGHANIWAPEKADFSDIKNTLSSEDAYSAAELAHEKGALFSINHPTAFFCCPWDLEVEKNVDSVEIWNSMYRVPNFNLLAGHPFWDFQLLKGERIPAVGGSDTHEHKGIQGLLFNIGNPTTWVYSKDKSGEAVIDGIRNGRTSLSYAPDQERLDLSADRDKDGVFESIPGDNIQAFSKTDIKFKLSIENVKKSIFPDRVTEIDISKIVSLVSGDAGIDDIIKGAGLVLRKDTYIAVAYKNGMPFRAWVLSGGADKIEFSDTVNQFERASYRAEIMGNPGVSSLQKLLFGRVLAVTSPVYANYPR